MDSMRKIQMVELDILKEFIQICKTHNLKYYAIGGTALGAVRHKGFIPWDDDIDVSMPRDDYEKFHEIVSNSNDMRYAVETIFNTEKHINPIIKLVDRNVVMTGSGIAEKITWYAYIDIFPLDGMPSNSFKRYLHVRRFLVKRKLFVMANFKNVQVNETIKKSFLNRCIKKVFSKFKLYNLLNTQKIVLSGDKLLKKYCYGQSEYCSPQLWGQYRFKAVMPSEWFAEGTMLPFEGIEINAPAQYEKYLAQLYGSDYMELPPVEKRATHSSQIVFREEVCENFTTMEG